MFAVIQCSTSGNTWNSYVIFNKSSDDLLFSSFIQLWYDKSLALCCKNTHRPNPLHQNSSMKFDWRNEMDVRLSVVCGSQFLVWLLAQFSDEFLSRTRIDKSSKFLRFNYYHIVAKVKRSKMPYFDNSNNIVSRLLFSSNNRVG